MGNHLPIRTILLVLFINCFAFSFGQTVFYVNGKTVVSGNDTLFISGNLVANTEAYFDNRNQVYIYDSLINLGSDDPLFEASSYGRKSNDINEQGDTNLISRIGTILLTGLNDQIILSESTTLFNEITISKENDVVLLNDINALGTISFEGGNLNLNGRKVLLYYKKDRIGERRTGILSNESNNNKIIDTIPYDNTFAINRLGYVEAKKQLSNGGTLEILDSIGLLNHNKSGMTTYRRYHFSDTMVTGGSLKKIYQLVSSGNEGVNITQTIKYLDSDTVLATNEDSLMVWQYVPAAYGYDTNYTRVNRIYFPSEPQDAINTETNIVQGIVTLEPDYIYTVAPINCDDVPNTSLIDSLDICAGSLVKLNPWEGTEADYRDYFYNWTAPNYISQSKVNGQKPDSSVYEYSFTAHDSIIGRTFPIYVEIRDVKGCHITDSVIVSVRDNTIPVLQMYDTDFQSHKFAICAGESFYIRDTLNTDSISTRYTWSFNSDTIYNQTRQVAYSLPTAGINKFSVQYTNEYGCVARKNAKIIVHPYPAIQVLSEEAFCQGSMSTIRNNTSIANLGMESAINSYSWNIASIDSIYVGNTTPVSTNGYAFQSDSVSIQNQNPDLGFLFENSGLADIVLTARSTFGCISSDTTHFYINPSVIAQFDTSNLTNVCNGSPSLFFPGTSCSKGADINYAWTFVDNRPGKNTDTAFFTFNGSRNYEVELMVTSDSGCSDTSYMDVVIHPNAKADFTVQNHCIDTSRITLFGNKSSNADTYFWDYGNGISDAIGSIIYDTAGVYSVILKANNQWNCIDSTSRDIEIYPLPDVSFTAKNSTCINAQNKLFTNTSVGTESYNWNFGDGTISYDENPNKIYDKSGLMPVELIGTSKHGCINSWTETIQINDTIEAIFNPALASVCEGQQSEFSSGSDLTGLVGITWVFGDGNSQFAPNTAPDINYTYTESGVYTASMISQTDSGCTGKMSAIVTIAPQPQISIETEGQLCENSELVFSLTDGSSIEDIVSYQWNFDDPSNPANNFSSSPTASHFYNSTGSFSIVLEVLSDRACRASDTLQIAIDPVPQILFGEEPVGTCETTLELIAGPAGLNYLWSNGSSSNTLLISANDFYSVSVTNPSTGCSNWRETYVELSSEVKPGLPATIQVCDSISIDAHNPGGSYIWSTGATSRFININTSGSYWVEVTDINGCIGKDTLIANISSSPDISLPEVILACEGNQEILDPGVTTGIYTWNTGSTNQTLSVGVPGYYWVNVTDANNCTDIAMTNVIFNPVPIVFLGDDRNICEDKLTTISAGNPGCNYVWSTGENLQAITPIVSGIFSVDVTNRYGCVGSDTVEVKINALPIVNLGGDQSLCENDELILDAGIEADVYYWSSNAYTRSISVKKPGNYWVRVTDNNNCTSVSGTVNVSYRAIPEQAFDTYEQEACNFMLLDAGNAGSTYRWNDGNTGRNYLAEVSNIYWVDITNSLGCSLRDSVNLKIKPMAILSLEDEMEICNNGSGLIDAGYFGSDYTYLWNTGATEQFTRVFAEGLYKVNVIHAEGCIATDSVYVSTVGAPKVDLGNDMYLCQNSGLTLDAGTPRGVYFWGSTSGINYSEQVIPVLDTGKYWVYVIAPNGCSGTDTVEIMYTNQSIDPLFMSASHIRVGDTVRFVDLSVPEPSTYYWDFGDMIASSEKNPEHIYYTEESFNARLTVTNEVCSATIQKPLLVEGYNPAYLIKMAEENKGNIAGLIQITRAIVYPVPATDYVTLSLEISEPSNIALYLYSMNGQILKMEKFNGIQELDHMINISGLREGMYFLRLVTRNEAKTFKILKIR